MIPTTQLTVSMVLHLLCHLSLFWAEFLVLYSQADLGPVWVASEWCWTKDQTCLCLPLWLTLWVIPYPVWLMASLPIVAVLGMMQLHTHVTHCWAHTSYNSGMLWDFPQKYIGWCSGFLGLWPLLSSQSGDYSFSSTLPFQFLFLFLIGWKWCGSLCCLIWISQIINEVE